MVNWTQQVAKRSLPRLMRWFDALLSTPDQEVADGLCVRQLHAVEITLNPRRGSLPIEELAAKVRSRWERSANALQLRLEPLSELPTKLAFGVDDPELLNIKTPQDFAISIFAHVATICQQTRQSSVAVVFTEAVQPQGEDFALLEADARRGYLELVVRLGLEQKNGCRA